MMVSSSACSLTWAFLFIVLCTSTLAREHGFSKRDATCDTQVSDLDAGYDFHKAVVHNDGYHMYLMKRIKPFLFCNCLIFNLFFFTCGFSLFCSAVFCLALLSSPPLSSPLPPNCVVRRSCVCAVSCLLPFAFYSTIPSLSRYSFIATTPCYSIIHF
jgi:hypothetical protein